MVDASLNSLSTAVSGIAMDYDTGIDVIAGGRIQLHTPLTQYINLLTEVMPTPASITNAAGNGAMLSDPKYSASLSFGMIALRIGAIGSESNPKNRSASLRRLYQRAARLRWYYCHQWSPVFSLWSTVIGSTIAATILPSSRTVIRHRPQSLSW